MDALTINAATVRGWAVDADPKNDPTYPYRRRERDDHSGEWERPPLQESDVEILQSIEHIRTPAVFGTSTPPSGLSGMIRRGAFRWSESNWMHWLLLMGADRVNVVEGIAHDLSRGKVPNIPAEMGMRAAWRHDKKAVATKVGVTVAVSGLLVLMMSRRKARKRSARAESNSGLAASN
ncbi:MAG TPA: hypothetical protein VGB54_05010 [Allosphingosinicella sp.]